MAPTTLIRLVVVLCATAVVYGELSSLRLGNSDLLNCFNSFLGQDIVSGAYYNDFVKYFQNQGNSDLFDPSNCVIGVQHWPPEDVIAVNGTLHDVLTTGELHVAMAINSPGLIMAEDDGNFSGLEVDIINDFALALARRYGKSIRVTHKAYETSSLSDAMGMFNQDTSAHIFCNGITYTTNRARTANFGCSLVNTRPACVMGPKFTDAMPTDHTALNDPKYTMCTIDGTVTDDWRVMFFPDVLTKECVKGTGTDPIGACIEQSVVDGECDFVAVDLPVFQYFAHNTDLVTDGSIKLGPTIGIDQPISCIVRLDAPSYSSGNEILVSTWNRAFSEFNWTASVEKSMPNVDIAINPQPPRLNVDSTYLPTDEDITYPQGALRDLLDSGLLQIAFRQRAGFHDVVTNGAGQEEHSGLEVDMVTNFVEHIYANYGRLLAVSWVDRSDITLAKLITAVRNGDYLMALGSVSARSDRADDVLFGGIYFNAPMGILLRNGMSPASTIDDLNVGSVKACTFGDDNKCTSQSLVALPNAERVTANQFDDCIAALDDGTADVFVCHATTFTNMLPTHPGLSLWDGDVSKTTEFVAPFFRHDSHNVTTTPPVEIAPEPLYPIAYQVLAITAVVFAVLACICDCGSLVVLVAGFSVLDTILSKSFFSTKKKM